MKTTFPSLLLVCLVSLGAAAQDVLERSDLGLVQRQITSIELLADRASSSSVDAEGARYQFDYSRFAADLERMRQGIHNYLSPSRAQPADLIELTDDYLGEAPLARPSNEHD
ncbi:RAQPRD family integrative conjugative element protein [Pseudomonas putida]|uniref:integrative conjugative element protein, RAQPRD family n=1 Tax=Pseudomonas putida TaxID=303 RepID=UPI0002FEE60A|nr:RAQPRD family integrative conjugative element protein [Pseudomonas putida]